MQDGVFWEVIKSLITILNMKTAYYNIILSAAREKFQKATAKTLLPMQYV